MLFWPRMTVPSSSSAPSVMTSSVQMAGSTVEPSGMRATRLQQQQQQQQQLIMASGC
jgi:hypothetical protein